MARPRGLRLNTPAFEAILDARGKGRTYVAEASGKNLSFVSDLAFGRYGASRETAKAIADALLVDPAVLFPELAGFSAPSREVAA